MEGNKLLTLLVTMTVGIIFIGALLAPVIEDTSATEDTFKNEGYFYLTKYTPDDDLTLEWDSTNPDTFTINGVDMTYHNDAGRPLSIILEKTMALRMNEDNARASFYRSGTFINTSETNPTFTFTYTGGTVTATNGATTKTYSDIAEIYCISPTGDYVMKKSDSPAYLNSGSEIIADSEIYASGLTYSGNNNVFWHLEGTIDDMEYPDTFNSNLTVSDQAIHGQYDTKHNDLYVLDNLTFTITNQSSVVFNVTASYFIVPAEVTADRAQHLDAGEIAILAAIPLMAIAALVLLVVRYFVAGRD